MHDPGLIGARAAVAVGALLALGGCSLIYDPGSFTATDAAQTPDGMPDARPIDALIADADIEGLDLLGTEPVNLAEGSGCVWDGLGCTEDARAVPIVVNGVNIHPSAIVTLDGAGFTAAVVPAAFSEDHNMLAIAVRIPPDLGIDDAGTATLTITVAQGTVSDFVEVTVDGLDDFVASVDAPGGNRDIAASPLDTRYATIDIDADIRFTGDVPVNLVATSAITLDGVIDVSGFDAGDALVFGAAGPGGCRGGVEAGPGQCGDSAGGGAADNEGGGGGGHRTNGDGGVGVAAGGGGDPAGGPTLAPFGTDNPADNRGNGGGGGGGASLTAAAGGAGGGGGGTLMLTSGGSFSVAAGGRLTSNGGVGGTGGGTCLLGQHGGGGGGGSGGAILIRGWATFLDGGGTVSVDGGAGGDPPNNNGCNDGGDGSDGRVRIDLPAAAGDPALVSGTMAFRGIVINPALPPISTTSQVEVVVFGAANEDYRIQVEGESADDITVPSSRMGNATLDLQPGMNRICVLVNDSVTASSDEGAQCVTIAYMPQ